MSTTRWGNLKSGKLNIIRSDQTSDTKNLNGDECNVNSVENSLSQTKNSDFIQNCITTKSINKNCDLLATPSKNSVCSSSTSSFIDKEDSDKFFVPVDIKQIYKGFTHSVVKTQEIFEYFFDSCSSGEENNADSEIKKSDLVHDSDLYNILLRLKKRTLTPWHAKLIRKTSVSGRRRQLSYFPNKTSKNKSSKTKKYSSNSSEKSFSDDSEILSEDEQEIRTQLENEHKYDGNLKQSVLKFIDPIQAKNTVTDDNSIKNLQEEISHVSIIKTCETIDDNIPILEKTSTEKSFVNECDCVTNINHLSVVDADNCTVFKSDTNFGTSTSEDYNCVEQKNIIANNSSNFCFPVTIESFFANDIQKSSVFDNNRIEIAKSTCNENNMEKFTNEKELKTVSSSDIKKLLKNTDSNISKSILNAHEESDTSIDNEQYNFSYVKDKPTSSHSDIHGGNSENTGRVHENQNLNIHKHIKYNTNQVNKFDNLIRNMGDDKLTGDEEEKRKITSNLLYNECEKRSFHNFSPNYIDTDEQCVRKSVLNHSEDVVLSSDDENNNSDQKDPNKASANYVIKLSSDSDSDSSHKKSLSSAFINRTTERHISVSSNNSNPCISDETGRPPSSFKGHESNNEITSKVQIKFSDDFCRRNEIWLVQCPKSMNVLNIKRQCLNVPNKTVVHDNGHKYECHMQENDVADKTIKLAIPYKNNKLSLNVIPLAGTVTFEEKVDVPKFTTIMIPVKKEILLPHGLKVRHPLLGLDYQCQPKTSVSESSDSYSKKKKDKNRDSSEHLNIDFSSIPSKKKKKKKRENDNESTPHFNDEGSDASLNYCFKSPKKKRKRSYSGSCEITSSETNTSFEGEMPKKKKKCKSRNISFEEAADHTQFDFEKHSSKKKKNKKKH